MTQKKNKVQQSKKTKKNVQAKRQTNAEVRNNVKQQGVRSQVQKVSGGDKKEHFLWVKVWVSYLLSNFMKDRGKIPDNINDKIIITNNMYITKRYMSIVIRIDELGENTPVTMLGVLANSLRDRGNKAILDFTCKNKLYDFDAKDTGLQQRVDFWQRAQDNFALTKRMRDRAVRCLYTVEVARSGAQLKNSRMYLTIRAKDIRTLNTAQKIITEQLNRMRCDYVNCSGSMKQTIEYISCLGNTNPDLKGTDAVVTSNTVLSQIVPNCGDFNDLTGYYIGENVLNGSPYLIDFSKITIARNMLCVAPSGVGKTVLALNVAQSAYENGSAVVLMDIKGNEFTNFIKATKGYTVSLRPNSIEYINSFVMHKEDLNGTDEEVYFKDRLSFSKQQMIILSGITDREELLEFEELLDEFLQSLYVSIGVSYTNANSWVNTQELNPYVVFDRFERYLTPAKAKQYNVRKTVMGTLKMYMSALGSKSYIFKHEFDYASILGANTLSFDFGILANTSVNDIDVDLFRLKFLYMQRLNARFTTRRYAEGKRTFKVLEESQIVSPEVMRMYVEEYTLRRAQMQDTLLLGNSMESLHDNTYAKPLIENTTGLFIGDLTKDARIDAVEQFGLKDIESLIMIPGSSSRYKNSFLFINNMEDKKLYPIIQVEFEPDGDSGFRKYKIYTPAHIE